MRAAPSRSAAALVGLVAATMAGCHRPTTEALAAEAAAAVEGPSDAEGALAPARCRRTDQGFALDEGHGLDDLEIGDAVSYPNGYAVGLVRRASAGRVAAVALFHREPFGLARIVDLGPTLGDAPPPLLGWRPPDLVAAAYVRPPATREPPASTPAPPPGPHDDATREVALYAITGDAVSGAPLAPLVLSQRRDDSLALDLAFAGPAGLLVWDEATSAPRGVVKAAPFAKDHAATAHDVSPPESDAELPRVVAEGAGFRVVWIARRAEPVASDASEFEATGEPRAYGWLEMISVDERGSPTGPMRRLTQTSGHVSAFDLDVRSADGAPTLIIVARDDGEAVDGSGGTLLRVRVKGDVIEAPVAFATDGLGRGAPNFVSAPRPRSLALTWVARDENTRFLPLDPTGSPTAPPSAEDGLKDARPLFFLEGLDGLAAETSAVLVAMPSDAAAQLRVFACAK